MRDCSHYAGLTHAQNDAEAPVVKVFNESKVWRDKRNNDYEFQTVYSLGNFDVYKGTKDEFNKVFQASGLGIMRRECKDCRGDQHNDKFFVRKTSPERFDAWQYLVRSQGLRISLSLSQILSVSVSISLFPPSPPHLNSALIIIDRITALQLYNVMHTNTQMVTWSTNNNAFHRDFDIYSSLDDALASINLSKQTVTPALIHNEGLG